MPPTAAPIVVVAILPTIVAAIIVLLASSRSWGDISAPRFPIAKSNCAGLSKIAESISAGETRSSKATATSAVITTSLPFSSWRTSTGCSAGKSSSVIPASAIDSTVTASPLADSMRASATSSFSASVNFPSWERVSERLFTSDWVISPSAESASIIKFSSAPVKAPHLREFQLTQSLRLQ